MDATPSLISTVLQQPDLKVTAESTISRVRAPGRSWSRIAKACGIVAGVCAFASNMRSVQGATTDGISVTKLPLLAHDPDLGSTSRFTNALGALQRWDTDLFQQSVGICLEAPKTCGPAALLNGLTSLDESRQSFIKTAVQNHYHQVVKSNIERLSFGRALETASKVEDIPQRTKLLRVIGNAAIDKAHDFYDDKRSQAWPWALEARQQLMVLSPDDRSFDARIDQFITSFDSDLHGLLDALQRRKELDPTAQAWLARIDPLARKWRIISNEQSLEKAFSFQGEEAVVASLRALDTDRVDLSQHGDRLSKFLSNHPDWLRDAKGVRLEHQTWVDHHRRHTWVDTLTDTNRELMRTCVEEAWTIAMENYGKTQIQYKDDKSDLLMWAIDTRRQQRNPADQSLNSLIDKHIDAMIAAAEADPFNTVVEGRLLASNFERAMNRLQSKDDISDPKADAWMSKIRKAQIEIRIEKNAYDLRDCCGRWDNAEYDLSKIVHALDNDGVDLSQFRYYLQLYWDRLIRGWQAGVKECAIYRELFFDHRMDWVGTLSDKNRELMQNIVEAAWAEAIDI